MVTTPLGLIAKAETVLVPSAVEVAMKRELETERKLHKLFAALLSVRRSCGALDVPIVTAPRTGVEVPIPTNAPVSMMEEFENTNVVPFHLAR